MSTPIYQKSIETIFEQRYITMKSLKFTFGKKRNYDIHTQNINLKDIEDVIEQNCISRRYIPTTGNIP